MRKFGIPWWGKIVAKICLSRIPLKYSTWKRLGLFRHGQMDADAYATRVISSHLERAGLTDSLQGKVVLELGPGDSIATAIIVKAHGGCAVLVDTGAFVRADISLYVTLAATLTRQGLALPDLSVCRTIDDILSKCDAQYMTSGLASLNQLETASVDLIFSQAVLEHVRMDDFLPTMLECRRILKKDRVCSHQVDLRDHLGGELNNLRFGERTWESNLFVSSGFYTNRIRFNEMISLFEAAGFHVEISGVKRWSKLPTPKDSLSAKFRSLSEEELSICQFDVILR